MRRYVRQLVVAAVLALAAALFAAPASAVQSMVVQNVDTSAYPLVRLTLVVSPDAVTAPGEVPQVRLTENGFAVADVAVSSLARERGPIDVVLVIDASGSMKGRPIEDAKAAARRFIESMQSSDRIALVAFSTEPQVLQPFTADRGALFGALDGLVPAGETALYDGLVQAASLAASSPTAERYLVVLSDGGDTLSLNSADNAARAIGAAAAPVYAVALESPEYSPSTLEAIAGVSGGRMTTASDSSSLTDIYQSIAREMQLRYRVEYTSARPNTPDLALSVTVGSGEGAATSAVSVRNPRFDKAMAVARPLSLGRPNGLAFALSIASAFGGMGLLAGGAALMFRRDKAAVEQLRYYDQLRESAKAAQATDDGSTRGAVLSTLADVAERRGFTGMVQQWLDLAGVSLRANEYIFFHVLGTIVVGLVVRVALPSSMLVMVLAVAVAVVAPIAFLRLATRHRERAFDAQLPDILDLIAGSLRSGWGVQQSLDLVVSEVGKPAQTEFGRVQSETRLGLPLEEALQRMTERLHSDDLRWVVAAISIQREVGGNLAEVLNTVSRTIRARGELTRQVHALTAESRFSMIVLAVLPFAIFGLMFSTNPGYMLLAVGTPLGLFALGLGLLLLIIGIVWLNHIMKIEV